MDAGRKRTLVRGNVIPGANVLDAQLHQITGAKLAVNEKVKRRFANVMGQLQAPPDSPDFIQPQAHLLTDKFPLVPRRLSSEMLDLRVDKIILKREWKNSGATYAIV